MKNAMNDGEVAFEVIKSRGHVNITASHKTTIELTKDDYLTPLGDCIIGIQADKAVGDFSNRFKYLVRSDNSIVIAVFITENHIDVVYGYGSRKLVLSDKRKIIIRKSSYVDNATIMINANKAARDLSRQLVEDLVKGSRLYVLFVVFRINRSIL